MLKRPTAPATLALLSAGLFGISTPLAKLLVSAMPPLMLAALLYLGIRNLVWVSGFMAVVALISKDGF